jgi:hypothetical protein
MAPEPEGVLFEKIKKAFASFKKSKNIPDVDNDVYLCAKHNP